MPKIAALLVVHNDGDIIEPCLQSLVPVVDEIRILHDGKCSDNTLQICRKYTPLVREAKQYGYPEVHRVTLFEECQAEWLIIIDADERLSASVQDLIPNLVNNPVAESYHFLWRLWNGKKCVSKTWPYRILLVKRSAVSFLATLHPDWSIRGKTVRISAPLIHVPPYNNLSFSAFKTKWLHWLRLHAEQICTPLDAIPRFQCNSPQLPKHIRWIATYGKWISPFIFGYMLFASWWLAPKFESPAIYRFSLLQAAYYFLLCWEVSRYKQRSVNI